MKPIIFSSGMVKAILDGRKTQTRRTIKVMENYLNCDCGVQFKFDVTSGVFYCKSCGYPLMANEAKFLKSYYQPSDILWVRESWRIQSMSNADKRIKVLFQDGSAELHKYYVSPSVYEDMLRYNDGKVHPSIHMPKRLARIFLRVTDVRIERLQNISEIDAIAEGVAPTPITECNYHDSCLDCDSYTYNNLGAHKDYKLRDNCHTTAKDNYAVLWNNLYEKRGYGWDKNPWVWVYSFERSKTK